MWHVNVDLDLIGMLKYSYIPIPSPPHPMHTHAHTLLKLIKYVHFNDNWINNLNFRHDKRAFVPSCFKDELMVRIFILLALGNNDSNSKRDVIVVHYLKWMHYVVVSLDEALLLTITSNSFTWEMMPGCQWAGRRALHLTTNSTQNDCKLANCFLCRSHPDLPTTSTTITWTGLVMPLYSWPYSGQV